MNHAHLVQKLSQAINKIGKVLPRAELSADLYQTDSMKAALSQLYACIILFFQRCVRWYNKGPLRRALSSIKTPFELEYKDLLDRVSLCSKTVEGISQAAARAELRLTRTLVELLHSQSVEKSTELHEMLTRINSSTWQILQIALCKSIPKYL